MSFQPYLVILLLAALSATGPAVQAQEPQEAQVPQEALETQAEQGNPEQDGDTEKKLITESYDRLFAAQNDGRPAGTLMDKEITAADGDTLQSISLKEFSTVGLWRHIAEYNQLLENTRLSDGQIIRIPRIYYRPREFAEVIYAHGDNQYLAADGSAARELARNDQIFLNDEIRTGANGFASILFRTGATINLQPSSHVRLIKLGCLETDPQCFIELQADEGGLVIDVPSATVPEQQQLIRIETPHAAAAVRGTRFDLSASTQDMLLGVTRGAVAVSTEENEVELASGFGIKAAQGAPLGEPIALLPATRFASFPPRLAATDTVAAVAIDGAVSYEWKLSRDQAAQQIVNQAQSTRPEFELGLSEAGVYFVHVRGIDENGLKGFSRSERINVAALDTSFGPITLSAERQNQDLIISVIEPQDTIAGYEIQLSTTESFIEPVSVDVGSAGSVIFSDQHDTVFVRARGLIEPTLITPFGPTLAVR